MIRSLGNWTTLSKYFLNAKFIFSEAQYRYPLINTISEKIFRYLFTMKVENPVFKSLLTPDVKELGDIFHRYGYELRIAGGAVRDLLMDKEPTDIDFASTATPDQMKEMFQAEGIRMINSKGETHGTIFVRMNDRENFEITTLRIDVKTDGRHADVVFTTDWELDASRRDLTINSMFIGLDGMLYDYFNGKEDLEKQKVVFVGDPAQRICEDYLRILRYFRFFGRVSISPDSHDSETLQAIKENMAGLAGISGERIWTELKKILVGNHKKEIMEKMIELGMAPYIGLPESPDIREFKKVCDNCMHLEPHPMTLLTAPLRNSDDLRNLHLRLKFSNFETNLSLLIISQRSDEVYTTDMKYYQSIVISTSGKQCDVQQWVCELFKYKGDEELVKSFRKWHPPKFPVNGNMLIKRGMKGGPKMKVVLDQLKQIWIDSNFSMTAEQILDMLPSILEKNPRQFLFTQCGPGKPKGWTAETSSKLKLESAIRNLPDMSISYLLEKTMFFLLGCFHDSVERQDI